MIGVAAWAHQAYLDIGARILVQQPDAQPLDASIACREISAELQDQAPQGEHESLCFLDLSRQLELGMKFFGG